jgi:hypothetical protein
MAKYYKERHETEKEEELKKKHKFFAWIPTFAKHIQYNEENAEIVQELNGNKALEVVETKLANDPSQRASEFLAAICWHHYHGPPETKSFELLEKRAATDEYIADMLIQLLSNHQSVCTVKGAVGALAGIKHPRAFEFLQRLLPQDVSNSNCLQTRTNIFRRFKCSLCTSLKLLANLEILVASNCC